MKKEKKYLTPEAEIVCFEKDDIILTSGEDLWGGDVDSGNDVSAP